MTTKCRVLPFDQPAGSFLLGVLSAEDVIRIKRVRRRTIDPKTMRSYGGVEREASEKRMAEIAAYVGMVDASLPTAVLLALSEGTYVYDEQKGEVEVIGDEVADVVDGQHRIGGLERAGEAAKQFMIPVVFILDPTEDQKALLFATINGKQTRVSASVIYENFEVIEGRCPQKSAHEIARAMNSDRKSPWYRKLKMLGKRVGADETLSQGTFVKTLLDLISSKPDRDRDLINRKEVVPVDDRCVFNEYWRTEQDAVILRVLTNMFLAASEVWKEDWGTSILTKTTGFRGLMKSLPVLVPAGRDKKHLDKKFFEDVFTEAKKAMAKERATLTADDFQPGGVGEKRLTNFVTNAAKAI